MSWCYIDALCPVCHPYMYLRRIMSQEQEGDWRLWCSPAAMMMELTTLCPDGPAQVWKSSPAHTGRSECRTLDQSRAERDTPPPSPSESRRCRLWAAVWAAGLLPPSPAAPARLSEACGKSRAGRRSSRRTEEAADGRKKRTHYSFNKSATPPSPECFNSSGQKIPAERKWKEWKVGRRSRHYFFSLMTVLFSFWPHSQLRTQRTEHLPLALPLLFTTNMFRSLAEQRGRKRAQELPDPAHVAWGSRGSEVFQLIQPNSGKIAHDRSTCEKQLPPFRKSFCFLNLQQSHHYSQSAASYANSLAEGWASEQKLSTAWERLAPRPRRFHRLSKIWLVDRLRKKWCPKHKLCV